MQLLNNLILHRNDRTCHDRGVCQSTTRQCLKACHMASGEPPIGMMIGLEAAHESNVHQLHADRRAAERAIAAGQNREEEADRPADSWATAGQLLAGFALLAVLAFGVLYSLVTPDSFLHQLGRAAMSL